MKIQDFIDKPHPFLAGMCESHLLRLAENAMEKHFEAGELIFREGDLANRFYLIRHGCVLLQTRMNGNPIPVQTISDGDVLGWSWLFEPYTWHFDARAETDTEAVFFYATRLREDCEVDKAFGYELMKRIAGVLMERLQATRRNMVKAHWTATAKVPS